MSPSIVFYHLYSRYYSHPHKVYNTELSRPDDGRIDFWSVNVDDRERSVERELAEHRQTD